MVGEINQELLQWAVAFGLASLGCGIGEGIQRQYDPVASIGWGMVSGFPTAFAVYLFSVSYGLWNGWNGWAWLPITLIVMPATLVLLHYFALLVHVICVWRRAVSCGS